MYNKILLTLFFLILIEKKYIYYPRETNRLGKLEDTERYSLVGGWEKKLTFKAMYKTKRV